MELRRIQDSRGFRCLDVNIWRWGSIRQHERRTGNNLVSQTCEMTIAALVPFLFGCQCHVSKFYHCLHIESYWANFLHAFELNLVGGFPKVCWDMLAYHLAVQGDGNDVILPKENLLGVQASEVGTLEDRGYFDVLLYRTSQIFQWL